MAKLIRFSKKMKFQYSLDIAPQFPDVESLLQKAERCTKSCVHVDQVIVSRDFFKSVALRGAWSKKYSQDEVKKAAIILDYMAEVKSRELYRLESHAI